MRITNQMTAELITRELYKNKSVLLNAQTAVATGKRINKPSDDPVGMGKVLDYRTMLSSVEQYNTNISIGKTHVKVTETALEQIEELLNSAHEIALQYGSNADTPNALENVQDIYDSILNLANTRLGSSYIFGGNVTDAAPFSRNADGISGTADDWVVTYNGDAGDIKVLAGDNVQIKVNANGQEVFDVGGLGGGTDVFASLNDLISAIAAGDHDAAKAEVQNIQNGIDQVQSVATRAAVYYGRLETEEERLVSYKNNIENMLDEIENVDMAQAIVEMQLQETAYTTSLEVASRIITNSLVDFLS